jgi:hypothetical protein
MRRHFAAWRLTKALKKVQKIANERCNAPIRKKTTSIRAATGSVASACSCGL